MRRATEAFGPVPALPRRRLTLHPDAKRTLQQAQRESRQLNDRRVAPEHLLLAALTVKPELVGHGATYAEVRERVLVQRRMAS